MRRLLVSGCLAVACAVALGACSGDEESTNSKTSPADAGMDLPVAEDMPRLADNGCPLPPEGTCVDEYSCTEDSYEIDAITCEVTCINTARCIDGDGCCAPGCNPSNDNDCEPGCGNAYLEAGELCDGDCPVEPSDCALPDACSTAIIVGSAETCDSRCFVLPIDRCTNDDGCCPAGCVSENDNDCSTALLAIGDVCTSSHQCPDSAGKAGICLGAEWKNGQGSICTNACSAESDCPSGWKCPEGVCLPPCTTDDECTTGLECTGTSSTSTAEFCDYLPWHPGGAPLGAGCEAGYECRGRTEILGGGCLTEDETGWTGGYCTMTTCSSDTDCTSQGVCISGTCFQSCRASGECRAGMECNDYFTVGKRICSPPVLSVAIGRECEEATDCVGSMNGRLCQTDFPGGYCTSSCASNAECPFGSVCDTNLEICVATCPTGTCRDGYACADIGAGAACYPAEGGNRAVGSSCSDASDCYSYDGLFPQCLDDGDGFAGGYCTAVGCAEDGDCGEGNVCVELDGSQGQCFLGCETVGESCRPGYVCGTRGEKQVCLPGGDGNRAIGEACADDSQCAGECVSELENANALSGYCTQACGGDTDPECPTGSHCVEDQCFPDCTPMSGTDVCGRQGYLCRDIDDDFTFECIPNGGDGSQALGEICSRDWQCSQAGAICAAVGDTRLCAVECQMGFCPSGASCDPTTNLCLPQCEETATCRTGFTCMPVPEGTDATRICDYGIFRLGL